jgi:serine O-acetyltransferase
MNLSRTLSRLTDPGVWWWWSHLLYKRGVPVLPKLIKYGIFVTCHALLPPETNLSGPVFLGHRGFNVVVNHTCRIGKGVTLSQGVGLAKAFDTEADTGTVTIEDGAFVGTSAVVLANRHDVIVGSGAVVGACAVVTRSVEAMTTVVGNPARELIRSVDGERVA